MNLYLTFELSNKNWKLGFSTGTSLRIRTIAAGDVTALQKELATTLTKWNLSTVQVVSLYEAGRDGFWLHRYLNSQGYCSYVVDPASILVNRRKRQIKTDRIDVKRLMQALMGYCRGDKHACKMVHVPDLSSEMHMRFTREIEQLKSEFRSHATRIGSLLKLHGLELGSYRDGWGKFPARLKSFKLFDGSALPEQLQATLMREYDRMMLVREQLRELESTQRQQLETGTSKHSEQGRQLRKLKGIGLVGSTTLPSEFFAWRDFKNVKEVGACAGLVGCPFASGELEHEQGISKAGNRRVRGLMIELAWSWLRYQPQSELSQWFRRRFQEHGKRMKRKGIVALARKLLVALGKYLQYGLIPEGAQFKTN